jgi:hypothetical protein
MLSTSSVLQQVIPVTDITTPKDYLEFLHPVPGKREGSRLHTGTEPIGSNAV